MRFHLIDRIESWEPDRHITARKVTSVTEETWQSGPDGPVLPFGLALEALCQTGSWLFLLSTGHRQRAALLGVDQVTEHRSVRPGDTLRMTADVVGRHDGAAVLDGTVSVDGEPVLRAEGIMCALIDAERLDDPADTARMAEALLGRRPV
ncbi:3-hydroxylacyl-ACP dehydratase [Streptomyces cellostaticus]|uniref:3-hydroxylacyl-ACP dehydratase n=1 Tax=Streptomyces cellostaticus TaxID=67285 RepID=A0A101NE66_9ACTN|nr:3-hydroxyacyl-ACP dehydratase FabZ family protein [Streptomyces cellostaticus]KUM91426.1 3-hydroxylacyl-ACP dehydratase [Streptomyces cellostaticus]GHI04382.1 3-hydroxyacyl-[acyl-carrier-protein] dehydratase FabZ [Streptomyces cellostaticus]